MSSSSQLVVVAVFTGTLEAHLACSALRAAGIIAHVFDEHIVSANWGWSNAVGGVKVMVADADVDAARELLRTAAEVSSDDDDAANAGKAAGDVCPQCGSDALSTTRSGLGLSAGTWLLLGMPIVPERRRTRCVACGHTFR